ncbi:MAG: class I adenylate-forming enzyme family protein [Pseudobdellovibrio sp.]
MPKYFNLGSLIDFSKDQNKLAVIDLSASEPRHYTYAQLNSLIQSVSNGLNQEKIRRGSKVVIIAMNSIEYLAILWGTLRAGCIPVLINWKTNADRINYILNEAQPSIIFYDKVSMVNYFKKTKCINLENELKNFLVEGDFETVRPNENEVAIIIYTSGSSGYPKGVLITHEAQIWLLENKLNDKNDLFDRQKICQILASPVCHLSGLSVANIISAGHGTLVLMKEYDSNKFAIVIQLYKVNYVTVVPAMMSIFVKEYELTGGIDLSSVLLINFSSAPLSENLVTSVKSIFPKVRYILNRYGLSEVGPGLFQVFHPKGIPLPPLSVGYPRNGIEYKIDEGVLKIKSPSMALGYLSSNEDSKSSLDENGFFNTKDLFKTDENGFYFYLGRNDDMINCGGENIYPLEIERLLESHPVVVQAIVVSVFDEIKGEKPYAFVLIKNEKKIKAQDLIKHCLENGSANICPRHIWRISSIATNANGKLDKDFYKKLAKEIIFDNDIKSDAIVPF